MFYTNHIFVLGGNALNGFAFCADSNTSNLRLTGVWSLGSCESGNIFELYFYFNGMITFTNHQHWLKEEIPLQNIKWIYNYYYKGLQVLQSCLKFISKVLCKNKQNLFGIVGISMNSSQGLTKWRQCIRGLMGQWAQTGEVRWGWGSFQEVINMQLIIKTSIITDLDERDRRL